VQQVKLVGVQLHQLRGAVHMGPGRGERQTEQTTHIFIQHRISA
jgi:hypothetical protein